MSKREQRRQQGAAWTDQTTDEGRNASSSLRDVTAQGYGLNIAPNQQRIIAKPVSIFDIQPDLAQPRRTIPSSIRTAWDGDPKGVKALFMVWWGEVQRERGEAAGKDELPFDLGAYLESGQTERTADEDATHEASGPLERSLLQITMLAASIRRDGLINPVTVEQGKNSRYRLETGERRWLAYHLLHAWFDGHDGRPDEREEWDTIPARVVEKFDVWRQASENNARDDLNGIGKARQFAVLMMDLRGMENFRPFSAFENEQDYYAQVAEMASPYGSREQLLNALGINSPSVLTRLRHFLRLPHEIWRGADDYNLSEEILEELYGIARQDVDKAIQRFREIIHVKNVRIQSGQTKRKAPPTEPGTRRHFTLVLRMMKQAGKGKKQSNQQALKTLAELRDWVDEQERIIRKLDS
ncbi:MAG: hypothetical protein EA396_05350 [Anaerolineaceae bacterium]|nr:MAG: hypothetical protein EA396_05350 [Anaerolineaceae bacterium]